MPTNADDPRLDPAPVVRRFVAELARAVDLVGLYAGGSLASGDYRPGISDLDLVAVVAHPLDDPGRARLEGLHRELERADASADKLHCAYVVQGEACDVMQPHWTWAHRELYPRHVTGIARAELLRGGIVVTGPPPRELFPPVDDAALAEAVRADLTGYWGRVVRKRLLWLNPVYVDLGLLTVARAAATLTDGSLITKAEAIRRLPALGVPADLVGAVTARREGRRRDEPLLRRVRHAAVARRIVADGIARLAPR